MVTIIACMFKKWLLRIINASLTSAIALKLVLYLFRVSKRFIVIDFRYIFLLDNDNFYCS